MEKNIQKEISGKLAIGIEFNGINHKDFTLGLATVKETFDAQEAGEANLVYLSILAKRLKKLGHILKKDITFKLLLDMYDADLEIILKAKEALDGRFESFLKVFEKPEKVSSSTS